MKTKTVKQYQCDFCGKKNYSSGHMKRHEISCTSNPNRVCKMCGIVETVNNLEELKKIMPKPQYPMIQGFFEGVEYDVYGLVNVEEMKAALEKLKEASGQCPACILAVLKQLKINCYAIGYDYKKERNELWKEINSQKAEYDYQNSMY